MCFRPIFSVRPGSRLHRTRKSSTRCDRSARPPSAGAVTAQLGAAVATVASIVVPPPLSASTGSSMVTCGPGAFGAANGTESTFGAGSFKSANIHLKNRLSRVGFSRAQAALSQVCLRTSASSKSIVPSFRRTLSAIAGSREIKGSASMTYLLAASAYASNSVAVQALIVFLPRSWFSGSMNTDNNCGGIAGPSSRLAPSN